MNIIRKIKINSLGMYEFNDSEKELVEFIKENMLNLTEVKSNKYTDETFYFKNNKFVFSILKLKNVVYVYINNHLIYEYFADFLELEYEYEIYNLIIDIIEYYYKISIFDITIMYKDDCYIIETTI